MFFAFVFHSYTSMFVKDEKILAFSFLHKKSWLFLFYDILCVYAMKILEQKWEQTVQKKSISSFKILLCTLFLI